MFPELNQEEIFRYARHLTIPEVGIDGQRKLKAASVLLVGVGGLGSAIGLYLAGAGVGRIGIVDYDVVDSSNLQRQVIHDTQQLGKPKVESARKKMIALNPLIHVDAYQEPFSVGNAELIAESYDMVIDGTDNFPSRYLINDLCVLTEKPYIYGSVYQFEGQVSVFDAQSGPCYRCVFVEPPPAESQPSGVQMGVFGTLPGTIGTIQVAEAIKLILGIGTPMIGFLLLYDALNMSFHKIQMKKNPKCKICGEHPEIDRLNGQTHLYSRPPKVAIIEDRFIEPAELAERLQRDEPIQLIDVRTPAEQKISFLARSTMIPLMQLRDRMDELDDTREIILFSRLDDISGRALHILLDAGFQNVKVLRGGLNAWSCEIDPDLFQY